MPITAQNNPRPPRELVPEGNHVARCYRMIEMGTIIKDNIAGQPPKQIYSIVLYWELPYLTKVFDEAKGPQPTSIHKEFALFMSPTANLRKMLESWRGKKWTDEEAQNFDVTKLIGAPCLLNVVHKTSKKGNQYEEISAITPVPQGMTAPSQVNPSFVLSFDDAEYTSKFNSLPDWLKEMIKSTPEYKAKFGSQEVHVSPDVEAKANAFYNQQCAQPLTTHDAARVLYGDPKPHHDQSLTGILKSDDEDVIPF